MSLAKGQRVNALLVVVAILLAAFVFFDRERVSTDEAKGRIHQLLDAWRPDAISELKVVSQGHRYELTRRKDADGDQVWRLRFDGRNAEADPQAVSTFLLTLEYASFDRLVTDAGGDLGFDAPALTVNMKMGALDYVLQIGAEATGAGGGRYARVMGGSRGDRRYVVSRKLHDSLTAEASQLRSRELIPYVSSELKEVSLRRGTGGWVLTRASWPGRMSADFMLASERGPIRASRRQAKAWLVALGRSEFLSVVERSSQPTKPEAVLTFTPLDGKAPPAVLNVMSSEGCKDAETLVVRQSPDPMAGCVQTKWLKALQPEASQWRDRYLLGVRASDVTELVAEADVRVEVARKDSGWLQRKPTRGKVDPQAVEAWLEQVSKAEGQWINGVRESNLSEYGLASPRVRFTVRSYARSDAGGVEVQERVERFDVGEAQADGRVYARRHDDGAILSFAEAATEFAAVDPARIRSRVLWEVAMNDVAAIETECGERTQKLVRSATGQWSWSAPSLAAQAPDLGLVTELADALRKLEAVRWLSMEAAPSAQATGPMCQMTLVSKAGEARQLGLRVFGPTEGGDVAEVTLPAERTGQRFVIPRRLRRLADQWLIDRGGLLVDMALLKAVELRGSDKRLRRLVRQSGTWLQDGQDADAAGNTVADALSTLVAETVIPLSSVPSPSAPAAVEWTLELEGKAPTVVSVGPGQLWRGVKVRQVRLAGSAFVFLVAEARLAPLFDAL